MSAVDRIPVRADLIRRIQRANRLAVPWILIQLGLTAFVLTQIRWNRILEDPLTAVVAVLVIVGPNFMGALRQVFLNKKEIGALKEQTKFGDFDKHQLRSLMNDTLDRLDLPRPGPPVYITADKSFNAGSVRLGFAGFIRSLNGVYLNRQVLHHLNAAEVQDLMGHELGHYYRYYLLNERFNGLTLLLGAVCGLLVAQQVGLSNIFSVILLCTCGTVFWKVSDLFVANNAVWIEYLCDSFGAQVHGVPVSINGLLKLGVVSETQLVIQQQTLTGRRQKNLNARDVIEAVEAAIPYGHTSREELERAVAESIKLKARQRNRVSLSGFLDHAWNGDDDETELDEQIAQIALVQTLPRLDWERLLDSRAQIDLNERQIEQLVELIETNPDKVLFHSPGEVGVIDGVHPPISVRILFLWRNREEIDAARFQANG